MQTSKASAKQVRVTARKARLVINMIRGRKVDEALAILKYTNRSVASIIDKILRSAIANAKHNCGIEKEQLYVHTAIVNEGPTLKRYQPRAKGSAFEILKRTSHITITVAQIDQGVNNGTKS